MMNIAETPTCTKPMLSEVLSKLAQKELQIKLFIGYRDCLNGYGWHVKYYVEVIQCIEYCPKCRAKENVNYSETSHIYNNHSHGQEYKTIFAKEFMSESDMCMELLNFA